LNLKKGQDLLKIKKEPMNRKFYSMRESPISDYDVKLVAFSLNILQLRVKAPQIVDKLRTI